LSDAKIILTEVLNSHISDSIISALSIKDITNNQIITLQKNEIDLLKTKINNELTIISNLNKILINKDSEISILNKTIAEQKKEIRKQKFLKVLGFISAIVVPITLVLIIK
jgi:hypothetical protein